MLELFRGSTRVDLNCPRKFEDQGTHQRYKHSRSAFSQKPRDLLHSRILPYPPLTVYMRRHETPLVGKQADKFPPPCLHHHPLPELLDNRLIPADTRQDLSFPT